LLALVVLFAMLIAVETERIENRVEPPRQFEVVGEAVITVLASPGILVLGFTLGREPLWELAIVIINSLFWGFGAVAAYDLSRRCASRLET
jgi:hypothetical protein